ncbi:hypothetical protein PPYR_11325 [Photinus pyralis]|uniref:Methyltransferase type 11 domain-containing protein n=1 Tax=Photinus pyralis TaxID=7054 RepID=A0A5N4AAX9_PHOPY|nr:hypothetical protein PPYR_11325 [Photinus pyralis]
MLAIPCPSMDAEEAKYFTKMSSVWWDTKGPYRTQFFFDSMIVPFIIEQIVNNQKSRHENFSDDQPLNGLKILEIGCGGGIVTEKMSRKGGDITGIDVNLAIINVAKNHLKLDPSITNVEYRLQSVEEHCLDNFEKYDVIILNTVLQHIVDKEPFLQCCIKCLKPGGSAFIGGMSQTWVGWFAGIFLAELLGILPRGTSDWNKFITLEGIGRMVEKFKCRFVDSRGMFYNVLTGNFFYLKSTSVTFIGHFRKDI